MIVIKIEMWPQGDEKRRWLMGVIAIVNVGGTKTSGRYEAQLTTLALRPDTKPRPGWKSARVGDFPRRRLGLYDLLYRVLDVVVGARNGGRV